MKRKQMRRQSRGFSLVETLVAALIAALVALSVASGTAAAMRSYERSLFVSESQMLSSILDAALSDLLRYASYNGTDPDGTVRFTNESYGVRRGSVCLDDGTLCLNPTGGAPAEADNLLALLGTGAYGSIRLTELELAYDPQSGAFTGAYTLASTKGTTKQKDVTFCYRPLNEESTS